MWIRYKAELELTGHKLLPYVSYLCIKTLLFLGCHVFIQNLGESYNVNKYTMEKSQNSQVLPHKNRCWRVFVSLSLETKTKGDAGLLPLLPSPSYFSQPMPQLCSHMCAFGFIT